MTNPYCFINGKIVKENRAKISVNDIGLHRGYGVFEVLRTYNGKPFLLNEHLKRLNRSGSNLNLKIPYNKNEISKIVNTLIEKNKFPESLVKIIVTGGESSDGVTIAKKPTIIILNKLLPPVDPKIYQRGVKLLTFEYQRFIPLVKNLNYIELLRNQKRLKKEKAFNLLYISDAKVLEGATCNIFIFKNNKLITPDNLILKGTTRNLVLKLARKHFRIEKRDVMLKELLNSDEVFITSTSKGIVPVVQIDNKIIKYGKPGSNTKKIIILFNQFIFKLNQPLKKSL